MFRDKYLDLYMHIYGSKSYMAFQFTLQNLTLDDIEMSNQGHSVFSWLFFIDKACCDYSVLIQGDWGIHLCFRATEQSSFKMLLRP